MSLTGQDLQALLRTTTIGDLIELAFRQQQSHSPTPSQPDAVFRKNGDTWHLAFAGKTIHIRHRIGLEYITYLLANPGEPVPVLSLYLAVAVAPSHAAHHRAAGPEHAARTSDAHTTHTLADGAALNDCRKRLLELEAEARVAQTHHDEARLLQIHTERQQLLDYLAACTTHNGHLRRMADTRERVRKSVSNAIARAIDAISPHHQPLARHLRNSLRTGYDMIYGPETPIEWQL